MTASVLAEGKVATTRSTWYTWSVIVELASVRHPRFQPQQNRNMKIRFLSVLVASISLSAFSQCHLGFVNGNNAQLDRLFVIGTPVTGDPIGPIPVSPLPSGHSLIAQLYEGTNADSMTLQGSSLLDTNVWAGGWAGPGLMHQVNLIPNDLACNHLTFFNVVVSDVVGALGSPFVPGPASGAVYYGTSGTFTGIIPSAIAYPPLWSLLGTSTWPATNLVINAVSNTPPMLTFSGNVLTWVGVHTLQSATNIMGPYADVTGALSPFTFTNTANLPQLFFRLRD